MPQVSVVIPTYNRRQLIEKAIESVLAQTYSDWEIVVIDNGSTDGTDKHLLAKYGNTLRLIRLDTNVGIPKGRNVGIREARGGYVALLDSDDYWKPNKLSRQMRCFEEDPSYGMVATQCSSVTPDGSTRERNRPGKSGWVLVDLFKANFIRTSSAVIKKEVLDSIGLFDEELAECEEYDLWLRVASKWPIGFINEPLTVYLDNPEGVSVDRLRGRLFRQKVLEKGYLHEQIPASIYTKRLARNCFVIGRHYLRKGEREEARRYLARSLKMHPLQVKGLFYYVVSCALS
jgi:glycosyltransferase involved in cell wall biosynthesis